MTHKVSFVTFKLKMNGYVNKSTRSGLKQKFYVGSGEIDTSNQL